MPTIAETVIPTVPGTPFAGGFFAGLFTIGAEKFALIVSPKASGENLGSVWNKSDKDVSGANSYFDGLANTNAMAADGSKLAKWALGLEIDGHKDWYLPSQDELEIAYRNLKPTGEKNYCWARSGINLSAVEPTRPYTPEFPEQTAAEAFREGGDEAFGSSWYWTSTQHASDSSYAWCQGFYYGYQYSRGKHHGLRARAVRRLKI